MRETGSVRGQTFDTRYGKGHATSIVSRTVRPVVGAVATAVVMCALVVAVVTWSVPNPNMILVTGLVVCGALFGLPGCTVAAVAMMGYTLYFFSEAHDFVTFTEENLQKVVITAIGMTAIGVFVCALKAAQTRALRDAEAMAELLAVDNSLLEEALTVDGLCGIRNRYALRRYVVDFSGRDESLYVMMLDLDDFKGINDSFGHASGDQVLVSFATALSDAFGTKSCYRFGGDEFLVICEGDDRSFDDRCERARARIAEITLADGRHPCFSGGYVFGYAYGTADVQHMIHQADECLYRSKRAGKDRIEGAPYDPLEKETAPELAHTLIDH